MFGASWPILPYYTGFTVGSQTRGQTAASYVWVASSSPLFTPPSQCQVISNTVILYIRISISHEV